MSLTPEQQAVFAENANGKGLNYYPYIHRPAVGCQHLTATGVDRKRVGSRRKVWRCHECGFEFRHKVDHGVAFQEPV